MHQIFLFPWSHSVMIFSLPFFLLRPSGRAPLHLSLRHRLVHLLLPEGERSGARLRQDSVLPCGAGLQERHRWTLSPRGHLDHVHEGTAQLLALWRDSLLLQRAAEHLLPTRAGPHLRHLYHQRVSKWAQLPSSHAQGGFLACWVQEKQNITGNLRYIKGKETGFISLREN